MNASFAIFNQKQNFGPNKKEFLLEPLNALQLQLKRHRCEKIQKVFCIFNQNKNLPRFRINRHF